MTDIVSPDLIAQIRDALAERPEGGITGAQVRSLMDVVVPDLNVREAVRMPVGPGALTKFIETYLSDKLEKAGKQGGDTLYAILGHPKQIQVVTQAASAGSDGSVISNIWRSFVSPASMGTIVCDRNSGNLRLLQEREPLTPSLIEIKKASNSEHDQIRAKFTEALSQDQTARIEATVGPDSGFIPWIEALKKGFPSTYREWGIYRRQELLELFKQRASQTDLDEAAKTVLMQQIEAACAAFYEGPRDKGTQSAAQPAPKPAQPQNPIRAKTEVEAARQLMHLAIDLMGHDELRAIKLPLGIFMDANRLRN